MTLRCHHWNWHRFRYMMIYLLMWLFVVCFYKEIGGHVILPKCVGIWPISARYAARLLWRAVRHASKVRSRYIAVTFLLEARYRPLDVFRGFEVWPKLLCWVQFRVMYRDISPVYSNVIQRWKPIIVDNANHWCQQWRQIDILQGDSRWRILLIPIIYIWNKS